MSTAIAHPNIALVKYWGKNDISINTPIHGSFSVTLDYGYTKTTSKFISNETQNQIILNNVTGQISPRYQRAIDFLQRYEPENSNKSLFINSVNSFPTAAGFASSASGAAAFVCSLAALIGNTTSPIEYWKERNVDLSRVSRMVSGSGCRSIYGGFVEWTPGDDETSIAQQIYSEQYWPTFCALSITLSPSKKLVSSADGMQRTVETVPWIQFRAENVVPQRINSLKQALSTKDFCSVAEITMKESNELHANCAASYPPFRYLTDESYQIIDTIHMLNKNSIIAAYTFDAGPNPFIFCQEGDIPKIKQSLFDIGISESSIKLTKPAGGVIIQAEN